MRIKGYVKRIRLQSVPCRSMREELEAVEQFGAELGESSPDDSYMFNKAEEVDMDAFHDRYLDKQRLGCSSDAASYFDQLSDRFGFACRKELESSPSVDTSSDS